MTKYWSCVGICAINLSMGLSSRSVKSLRKVRIFIDSGTGVEVTLERWSVDNNYVIYENSKDFP